MRKKIFLFLTLIVTLLLAMGVASYAGPVTQYGECEHPNKNTTYNYVSLTKHRTKVVCKSCGKTLTNKNEDHTMSNGKCTKCGYVSHTHSYTILKSDATYHWYECSCGARDTLTTHSYITKYDSTWHWKACRTCGYQQPNTSAKHTFGSAYMDDDAPVGKHFRDCTGCSYAKTEAHNAAGKYNTSWESYHWRSCSCGSDYGYESRTQSHSYSSSNHTCVCGRKYNNGRDVTTSGGSKVAYTTHIFDNSGKCKVCGTAITISGDVNNLPDWSAYTPGDPGNRSWTSGKLTQRINGVLDSNSYALACTYHTYTAHNATWHSAIAAIRPGSSYTAQLEYGGATGGTRAVRATISGSTITYSGLPTSGRVSLVLTIAGQTFVKRYTAGGGLSSDPGPNVTPTVYTVTEKYIYRDASGRETEIQPSISNAVTSGQPYAGRTVPSTIGNYRYSNTPGYTSVPVTITSVTGDITIVHYYTYVSPTITIKHVDLSTGNLMAGTSVVTKNLPLTREPSLTLTGDYRNKYATLDGVKTTESQKYTDKTTLYRESVPDNGSNRELIFYYEKAKRINVRVEWIGVDTNTGDETALFPAQTTSIVMGDNTYAYSRENEALAKGYSHLIRVEISTLGDFTGGIGVLKVIAEGSSISMSGSDIKAGKDVTITYYYDKVNLIVKYVDENGNPIPGYPEVTKPLPTSPTNETAPTIPGYVLKEVTKNGTPTTNPVRVGGEGEDVEIIFVYMPTLTVKYVDEAGNEISPSKTGIELPKGTNVTENAIEISGYVFKESKIDSGSPVANRSTVTVTGNCKPIEIVFVYRKTPTITARVNPPTDKPTPTDPSNPNNPNNTRSPYYGLDIIILDEVFEIERTIANLDVAPAGSTVRIKFPFDVYYNGEFKKANTEFVIETRGSGTRATDAYAFRLPSWIIEQSYKGQTTIKIVAPDGTVYDSAVLDIGVIGRLYDFTVTTLEGDTMWQSSMFGGSNSGKEYKADTLPIGQSRVNSNVSTLPTNSAITTQNTAYRYGIKLGSTFLFSVNTKGLKSDKIRITPMLEYYDKDGNKQNNVVFKYYVQGQGEQEFAGTNGLITATATGNNFATTLNKNTRRTTEVLTEMQKAIQLKGLSETLASGISGYANVRNAYKNFDSTVSRDFGSYATLTLPNTLRMPFANYAASDLTKAEAHRIGNTFANNNYTVMNVTARNLNYVTSAVSEYYSKASTVSMAENAIVNSLGHWYAEYKLPSTLTVKSSDGKTTYTNGYIVVRFKIESLDESGNAYLAYDLTQWKKENTAFSGNNVTVHFPTTAYKASFDKTIDVSNGYYPVAIYEAGQSINKDYEVAGTH
ncbi:MAG: MucBP domain-containing protein [Clostridia bacterium]|nr:MucBP domain-containing protein [Clostridia bacterium]